MRKIVIIAALIFVTCLCKCTEVHPYRRFGWQTTGDGTYKNPVINADYSDPDVIRVGDDYYMVSSSFEDIPGLPILHSKDLSIGPSLVMD